MHWTAAILNAALLETTVRLLYANEELPSAPQVQFSLLDRRPLNGMLDYCGKRGIKVKSLSAT